MGDDDGTKQFSGLLNSELGELAVLRKEIIRLCFGIAYFANVPLS